MKKLLYSTLSIAFISSAILLGCKSNDDDGNDDVVPPAVKGPNIAFQTNTGTYSGYTFAPTNDLPVSTLSTPTNIKIGVVITSNIKLKSTKMTVKFENQAESPIGLDSLVSTKNCNRDYYFTLPLNDKGTYTFTAYATDDDATTSKASIKVTAYGPLLEIGTDSVFSLKAVDPGHFSAYDLFNNEKITASGSANLSSRDIVDMSTSSTLSRSWKSQNGTEFVMSGVDGKLNGKTYSQLKSEADVIAAWNATSPKSTSISNITETNLIIAKSIQFGTTRYYVIGLNTINDDTGAENDFYEFHYQQ